MSSFSTIHLHVGSSTLSILWRGNVSMTMVICFRTSALSSGFSLSTHCIHLEVFPHPYSSGDCLTIFTLATVSNSMYSFEVCHRVCFQTVLSVLCIRIYLCTVVFVLLDTYVRYSTWGFPWNAPSPSLAVKLSMSFLEYLILSSSK